MSGIKGRSGRRPLRDEEKRLRIIDKAWNLVAEKLESNDPRRYTLAKDIVVRDITTHVKGEGLASKNYTNVFTGMSEGDLREFIGDLRKRVAAEESALVTRE